MTNLSELKKPSAIKKVSELKKPSAIKKVSELKKISAIKKVSEPKKLSALKRVSGFKRVSDLRALLSDFTLKESSKLYDYLRSERGDVPGWVLVVLMTTGLVTGIWALAAPRIDSILKNSLDSMDSIR